MNSPFWALIVRATGFLSIIPADLRYFHTHFCGTPLASEWTGPPSYTIFGKSKPANDFVSWATPVPIVSERAGALFRSVASSDVELLSFGLIKKRMYFALNVLSIRDYVDYEASQITWLPNVDEGTPRCIALRPNIPNIPSVFKLERIPSQIYISENMASLLVDADLTGFSLALPTTDITKHLIMHGEVPDEYGATFKK